VIPEYKYQVKDQSILTPPFKKFIILPLGRWLPLWIPANFITFFSSAFMLAAMAISVHYKELLEVHFVLIAIFIFAYLTGDLLDGFQAKRTSTSSALGEFLDHYLDAFVNVFMLLTIFASLNINKNYIISFSLMISYLAQTAVFYEQRRTGWLIFEKIGVFEAFIFSIIVFILFAFSPLEILLSKEIFSEFSYAEIMIISMNLIALYTLIRSILRIDGKKLWFVIFSIHLLFIVSGNIILPSPTTGFRWMIAFYSIDYISRIMHSHHTAGKEPIPDVVLPLMMLICLFVPSLQSKDYYHVMIGYSFLKCIFSGSQTIYFFRKHWVWVNVSHQKNSRL
jgi:phosphatidylglycerophosphate synthase